MRWTAIVSLLIFSLSIAGCGSSDAPTTAGAGGAAPPPPPGSSGPPAPGDGAAPPAAPAESAPPDGGQPPGGEGSPAPLPGDPTPAGALPPPSSPDGSPSGNPQPLGAASAEGGQPPGNASPDGGQPGETNPDGTPRRPPRPQTLREQAMAAFREGRDALGLKLLHAHFAVMPDAQAELTKKMAWYPALARPALGPKIGIAVHYTDASSPKDFRGSPLPIGSPELTTAVEQLQQNEGGDRGIGGTRRASKFGSGGGGRTSESRDGAKADSMRNSTGPAQLSYYTGQFGELLLDALEERLETGEYGATLEDVFREASRGRRPTRRNGNEPGIAGGDLPPDGSGADQPGGGRGGAGGALEGVEDEGRARRWVSRTAAQEAASLQQIKQISPCILWLGKEDDRDEIIKRAEVAKVDILAIFEMTVREARTGDLVNTKTTLRLISTKANKPVPGYSPESLTNITVEQWRQKQEKGLDPVEREVSKAIEALDPALKPAPLPEALTAERAKKRIADLVAEKPADPLSVIVEARFYAAKGLLPEEDFTAAAVSLLGNNGWAQLKEKSKIGLE